MKTKKLINTAFIYAISAIAAGVFYREFTKFNGFEGRTTLGFVHTHLFMLGMFFFLIAALFEKSFSLSLHKRFGTFFVTYNVGLVMMAIMLIARGIPQALYLTLSRGMSASISGIAGIAHIFLTVGIVFFFLILRKCCTGESH